MRWLGMVFVLFLLNGCATQMIHSGKTKMVDPDDILVVNDEQQRKMDEALAKYIKEHRQLVFLPGNWQVMAYCSAGAVHDALDRQTVLCKPPKNPSIDAVFDAVVYVLLKRMNTPPNTPALWKVAYQNRVSNDLCIQPSWRLMDIEADEAITTWKSVKGNTKSEIGFLRQETWNIQGKKIILDFSGHVAALFIRGVNEDGTCYDKEEEEEE